MKIYLVIETHRTEGDTVLAAFLREPSPGKIQEIHLERSSYKLVDERKRCCTVDIIDIDIEDAIEDAIFGDITIRYL